MDEERDSELQDATTQKLRKKFKHARSTQTVKQKERRRRRRLNLLSSPSTHKSFSTAEEGEVCFHLEKSIINLPINLKVNQKFNYKINSFSRLPTRFVYKEVQIGP